MKKILLILVCILAAACIAATPFLFSHSDMLPERVTEYYALKAQKEAAGDSADAQLMQLLLGGAAVPAVEATPSAPAFSWFGLYLALGAALAVIGLLVEGRRHHEMFPALLWTAALAVPMGLLGARAMYCLVNITFYVKDIAAPEAMLKVWEGGLSLAGALPCVALAGVFGAKLGKAAVGKALDALAPAMLIIALWSAMAAEKADVFYGPEIGDGRFPTVLALAVAMLAIMLLLLALRKDAAPDGYRFALTAFLYGTVMILVESLRRDGHMLWGFVHAEMLLDLAIALPALLWFARTKKGVLLSLGATVVLAGAVIALEFALDRSAIGDGLLYAVYAAVIGGYLFLGCACARKRLAV